MKNLIVKGFIKFAFSVLIFLDKYNYSENKFILTILLGRNLVSVDAWRLVLTV